MSLLTKVLITLGLPFLYAFIIIGELYQKTQYFGSGRFSLKNETRNFFEEYFYLMKLPNKKK